MRRTRPAIVAAALMLSAGPAVAHASERGHIMLLPTQLFILGGTLAVLASAVVMFFVPHQADQRPRPGPPFSLGATTVRLFSGAALAVVALLVLAGFRGPADPISNPLPGAIWTLWWVGFTLLCLVLGNLWLLVNPWSCITATRSPLSYPAWLGQWPAVMMFLAFALFELVYPTPADPPRLAAAVAAYVGLNLLGVSLFGAATWLGKAEGFSAYFHMVGRLSPVQWHIGPQGLTVDLGRPGRGLIADEPVSLSQGAFVLLALASVSFDGLSRSFWWVARLDLNPLEFPGRSAVILPNTAGLILTFAALASAYGIAVAAGQRISGTPPLPGLVMSIIPIAIAYHAAHYLAEFPVAAMQAMKELSDPFATGLDLLGTGGLQPPASIMMDHRIATLIYCAQTAMIVAGHVAAVLVAHSQAQRAGLNGARAGLALLPLNVLMVAYTIFGLWLLSTPVVS